MLCKNEYNRRLLKSFPAPMADVFGRRGIKVKPNKGISNRAEQMSASITGKCVAFGANNDTEPDSILRFQDCFMLRLLLTRHCRK